ncbi:MAG TPA: alpha/beta hydrolase [Fibrobacteria bacterium]|nr:alpha/beta hydrolase [Fibrobacteria bacterium]
MGWIRNGIFYVDPTHASNPADPVKIDPTLWTGMRLALAGLLFLAGLLAVCKPPSYSFWKLSIVVMEGGHFLVPPCLLLGFLAFRAGGSGTAAAVLFLGAALLYATTAWRAMRVARVLEREFGAAWPAPKAPAGGFQRAAVLSFADLFTGIPRGDAVFRTLVYKERDGRGLKLDFYAPRKRMASASPSANGSAATDPRPAACIVVVHGGGWDGGARSQLAPLNGFLAAEGYAVATLEYRLAPRHRYPAPMEDVADALAYLRAHAAELGIDASRFVLLGRSAGGQIALNAAYTFKDPSIKGVIGFYAPADMVFGYGLPTHPLIMDSRLLMKQYLGGSYPERPEAYVASSPVEHLAADSPPTLLLHGRPDVLVSFRHTVHMREKMRALGLRCFVVDLPWGAHGFDFVFRGPASQISLYFIERFLAEVAP